MLNKVPKVSITFWIIKILCTTVGETGADYLTVEAGLGAALTGVIMVSLLAFFLWMQFRADRYIPWVYWLSVVLLSVVGTQVTDSITDGLDISLYISTTVFSVLLSALFVVWYRCESTLSIYSIVTRRREFFYWGVIFLTFALGTASGDLATEALGLGFSFGTLAFAGLIALVWIGTFFKIHSVLSFWLAYILTRPLGASIGDFLSQSAEYGGMGWGTTFTSAAFLSVISALVLMISFSESDKAPPVSH